MVTQIKAPITGSVWQILVKAGDAVKAGAVLIIFESMKMEIPLETEDDGTVVQVQVTEGQLVTEGDPVVQLKRA